MREDIMVYGEGVWWRNVCRGEGIAWVSIIVDTIWILREGIGIRELNTWGEGVVRKYDVMYRRGGVSWGVCCTISSSYDKYAN